MPLFNRDLLVDRPSLIDPVVSVGTDSEEESSEEEDITVFGSGGGKTVHGIEFAEDQNDIIKASNLVAMLATGEDDPTDIFVDVFTNSAVQLNHVKDSGRDLDHLVEMAEDLDAHTIGVEWDEPEEDGVEVEEIDEEGSEEPEEDEESEE